MAKKNGSKSAAATGNPPAAQSAPKALSQRNRMILLIAGGQLTGVGMSLKALDPDSKGTDDLAGDLCTIGGQVLVAVGSDNLKTIRQGLELNIAVSQQWLANNPA